jgi:hypothetical protein
MEPTTMENQRSDHLSIDISLRVQTERRIEKVRLQLSTSYRDRPMILHNGPVKCIKVSLNDIIGQSWVNLLVDVSNLIKMIDERIAVKAIDQLTLDG